MSSPQASRQAQISNSVNVLLFCSYSGGESENKAPVVKQLRGHFHFISFLFISVHFISFHFISCHFFDFFSFSFHFISFHSFHFFSFDFFSFHYTVLEVSLSAKWFVYNIYFFALAVNLEKFKSQLSQHCENLKK